MVNILFRKNTFNFKSNPKGATLALVELSVLTAIVVVLQLLGSFIHFGLFSVTLVLIPVVLGAALYGPLAGAWLGLVFGVTVLLSGDAAPFLAINPAATVLVVLLKGAGAGFAAGLIYRLLAKKNTWVAAFAAALLCPIANTGIFLIGGLLFFLPTLREWGEGLGYPNVGNYIIFGLVGGNFLFEVGVNLLLAPGLHRVLLLLEKRVQKK